MPTIGRSKEVYDYIESLEKSYKTESTINLLIIDQNSELLNKLAKYNFEAFNGTVYRSKIKGLSKNRNIGLSMVKEGVCAFPDDDCLYYEDTMQKVEEFFVLNPDVDVLLGRIYDRAKGENIIKNWPVEELAISKLNFYQYSSSITIFLRDAPKIMFDERLGAGTPFGSCEDPDFLYELIKQGKKIRYTPTVEVWHPTPDVSQISLDKVNLYAKGFGGFIRKDFDSVKFLLLVGCVVKKSLQFLTSQSNFKKGYFKAFFLGLFLGLTKFNNHEKK